MCCKEFLDAVEEEKAITSRQSRSIRLSNIRVSVKAKMLAEWFQQYGEVVEVKLNALSLQLKSHDRYFCKLTMPLARRSEQRCKHDTLSRGCMAILHHIHAWFFIV